MIHTVTYTAETPGPKLLVLGSVHGNETCGASAIRRVLAALDAGQLEITRGQVTFVPVCNPRAYEAGKRFVERDLNRYLVPMESPDCYEARLGNILCPLLAECDALLDIHSYTIGGEAFVVMDASGSKAEHDFAACLGGDVALLGWSEAYAASGRASATPSEESTGTVQYARRFGALAATIECGQHNASQSPDIAYRAIRNALAHLGMVADEAVAAPATKLRRITMTRVYYRDEPGELAKTWHNFERVVAGQPMAVFGSGATWLAPEDGVIILPKPNADVGEEWFYFGVENKETAP